MGSMGNVEKSKPSLLVIDDDALSLELYTRELSLSYRVIGCQNVEDAQQCFRNTPLAAVILEPAINEEEGWLLLEEIRSLETRLPVIVCSVLDERKAGLEHGAEVFLVKPVLPTTLHRMIDQIVLRRNPPKSRLSSAD